MKPLTNKAFSLVEVIIALGVVGFLTLGVMVGTMQVRKASEATVYSSIAESITIGFLEQLKGEEYGMLEQVYAPKVAQFPFRVLNYKNTVESTSVIPVTLNDANYKSLMGANGIPINSTDDEDPVVLVRMDYQFRVTATKVSGISLILLRIDYRYKNPVTGKWIDRQLGNARSSSTR